ncbi:hypothetical protein GCM10010321_37720 [Streptomyces chartreusis]|nr:hypothetical protein GCM10010321_37720 [Streptomyces chartreusis]
MRGAPPSTAGGHWSGAAENSYVWFLLGPCEDVGGTDLLCDPEGPVHLRFPASYTTLPKAQKDPGAALPESSVQQNSRHGRWHGRSCGTIYGSSEL